MLGDFFCLFPDSRLDPFLKQAIRYQQCGTLLQGYVRSDRDGCFIRQNPAAFVEPFVVGVDELLGKNAIVNRKYVIVCAKYEVRRRELID